MIKQANVRLSRHIETMLSKLISTPNRPSEPTCSSTSYNTRIPMCDIHHRFFCTTPSFRNKIKGIFLNVEEMLKVTHRRQGGERSRLIPTIISSIVPIATRASFIPLSILRERKSVLNPVFLTRSVLPFILQLLAKKRKTCFRHLRRGWNIPRPLWGVVLKSAVVYEKKKGNPKKNLQWMRFPLLQLNTLNRSALWRNTHMRRLRWSLLSTLTHMLYDDVSKLLPVCNKYLKTASWKAKENSNIIYYWWWPSSYLW